MAAAAPAQYVISGVGCMVWAAWCGLHGVGGMVWAAWCGLHGVGGMVWTAWCGLHGVGLGQTVQSLVGVQKISEVTPKCCWTH